MKGKVGCLEIKTRTKPTTIARDEEARREFGRLLWCTYGDETFNKCVLKENQCQVLHQAAVTKSSVGVFVTAKVEEHRGSIFQIVVFNILPADREGYFYLISEAAKSMLGWYLDDDLIEQGFIEDSDFPGWVEPKARDILKSRAKLLHAHYKFIMDDDGKCRPCVPLLLYKHYVQRR